MEKTEILNNLESLEKVARKLEPSTAQIEIWSKHLKHYTHTFIQELPKRPAFYNDGRTGKAVLALEFEQAPRSIDEIIPLLDQGLTKTALNAASPKHFGYVPGGGLVTTAFGDYLASLTNVYAGIFFAGPMAVRIENQLIRWMGQMVGFPDSALGNLTSGGSIANLIAITTARDFKELKAVEFPRAVIYLTKQVHHCVQKALRIAGLRESVIRYIPMDHQFRMNPTALQQQIEQDHKEGLLPFLPVGSAGTTDVGAIDPLDQLADIAEEYDLWFHVDAAYGGFFLLVDNLKKSFSGIERSDSVAIDPHKSFFLSYGLGTILVKDPTSQYRAHYYQANYMQDSYEANEELSPADLSPELTKHFRGLRMWLSIQLLGLKPFQAALSEKRLLSLYFYQAIQEKGFEVGPPPQLSICIFRYVPPLGDANLFNQQVLQYVWENGSAFASSTTINGVFWIRMAILNFRSHKQDVDHFIELIGQGVEKVKGL